MGKRTIPNAFYVRNATKAYLERNSTLLKKRKFVKNAIRQLKGLSIDFFNFEKFQKEYYNIDIMDWSHIKSSESPSEKKISHRIPGNFISGLFNPENLNELLFMQMNCTNLPGVLSVQFIELVFSHEIEKFGQDSPEYRAHQAYAISSFVSKIRPDT